MGSRKKAAAEVGRFQIFKRTGKTGATVALDLSKAEAIETDGDGKYFVYIAGRQYLIVSDATLGELAGGAEDPAETDTE